MLCLVIAPGLSAEEPRDAIIDRALDAMDRAARAVEDAAPAAIPETPPPGALSVKTFYLKYVTYEAIREKIQPLLTPGTGSLQFEELIEKLAVMDTPEKIEAITEIIENLDRKVDVPLDGRCLQIQLKDDHQAGIDWPAILSQLKQWPIPDPRDPSGRPLGELNMGIVSGEDMQILLEALDTIGTKNDTDDISVQAIANREIRIPWVLQQPLEMRETSGGRTGDGMNYDFSLFALPQKTGDALTMKIRPVVEWIADTPAGPRPWPESSSLVDVPVRPGETIVISGFYRYTPETVVQKTPVLGDLPFVSAVFRRNAQVLQRTEWVVFLTPRPDSRKN